MTLRREQYVVVVQFVIEAPFIGDDSFNGVPVQLAHSSQIGNVVATLERAKGSTTALELRWEFEDWYTEDSHQDFQESRVEMCRKSGILYIPAETGGFESDRHVTGEVLFDLAKSYFARLALVGRRPDFWDAIRNTVLDGRSSAKIFAEVAGCQIALKEHRFWAIPGVKRNFVTLEQAKRFGIVTFPRYANFLLTADRRRLEGANPDAIVQLAQGLEIAAYDYVRRAPIDLKERWHFSPPDCFGPKRHKKILAQNSSDLSVYPAICELFGARHEWIHEGRAKIRAFAPQRATGYDESNLRDLTLEDYYVFRSAVSTALQWMGELPIE